MTTAFMILSVRVFLVYVDFFLAVFGPNKSSSKTQLRKLSHPAAFDGTSQPTAATSRLKKPKSGTALYSPPPSDSAPSSRRGSTSNSTSQGTSIHHFPTSQGRDFEGLGGWRIQDANATNAEEEDGAWTSFNKRLELPSPVYAHSKAPLSPTSHRSGLLTPSKAHHVRTPTTGSLTNFRPSTSHLSLSTLKKSHSGVGLGGNSHTQSQPLPTAPAYVTGHGEGYFSFQPVTELDGGSPQAMNQSKTRSGSLHLD